MCVVSLVYPCMYMYIHICMYTYDVRTYVHVCMYVRVCTMYVCACMYMVAHVCTRMYSVLSMYGKLKDCYWKIVRMWKIPLSCTILSHSFALIS